MKKGKVEKGVSDNAPSSKAAATTGSAASRRVDCASSRRDPTKKFNDFGFSKVKNIGLYKSVTHSTEFLTLLHKSVTDSTTLEKQMEDREEELILLS